MKILVYPHDMAIGGSQINAIELAGAVSRRGHEVAVFGVPGTLNHLVDELGLEFIEAPALGPRPWPPVMRALTRLVRERGIDVVHGYEWPPALEAAYGPHLRNGSAVVATVMSMGVAPFLPHSVPLVVGTRAIHEDCLARGRTRVHLLEPPIDTAVNAPDSVTASELAEFDARWRLDPGNLVVVVVSRLAQEMKREGILSAVEATAGLADSTPIRLVIVGDGPAFPEVAARAEAANLRAGREVVTLTGAQLDPRPAYARADIVLGMGSSALRGMAFGKPLVVQGERGFWQLLTESTLPTFQHQGWYGIGDGGDGVRGLTEVLMCLASDPARRAALGAFSRTVVSTQFSLDRASGLQETWYEEALADQLGPFARGSAFVRSAAGLTSYKFKRRYLRLRGTAAAEDFNAVKAQPSSLAGSGLPR